MFAPGNAQIEVFKKNLEIHRMITIWRWKQVWLQTNAMMLFHQYLPSGFMLVPIKLHTSSACYMMALLMNLGLLCLGLLPSRRRLHECLQNSLQTMCPWSKTFLCTSQNDEPLPSRNALPNVAIDEKRAAATVFSHCSWGYFLLAALFYFVHKQRRTRQQARSNPKNSG